MNAERLLALFERVANAPDAILKLRQLILNLAVRGRLVQFDPMDEPAAKILEIAGIKRLALSKEKKNRLPKPLLPITSNEFLFEAPDWWEWCHLDSVCAIVGGVTKGRKLDNRKTDEYPYLRVANVQAGYVDLSVIKTIEIPIDELETYQLKFGDILLTEGGDWDKLGRSAVWQDQIQPCIHQNHIFRARSLTNLLNPYWISLFTNSPIGRAYFQDCSKKTTNLASINMRQLRHCPLPIPPAHEQTRILSRVDELMALCDQLDTAIETRRTTTTRLLDALIAEALADNADPATVEQQT